MHMIPHKLHVVTLLFLYWVSDLHLDSVTSFIFLPIYLCPGKTLALMSSGPRSSSTIPEVFVNVMDPGVAGETQITKLANFYFLFILITLFQHGLNVVSPSRELERRLFYDVLLGGPELTSG